MGAVDTNALQNNGGLVGLQASYPTSMPPLPRVFTATPGTTNVTVAPLQNQTLNPGNYGTLTDNGTLFLNPGTYSFSSVALGNNAQLLAQPGGSTSVRIAGALVTGTFAHILPVGQAANALTISVSGADGSGGSPPAVSIGANSQIVSLLAAPNGTISLGNNAQATGTLAGINVVAGTNVQLAFQSGFPVETPTISTFVAYAELSLTLATGVHSFGGDIGVAATAPTSLGTQLSVGNFDDLDEQHTLFAPSVSLGSQAEVGDVEANTLQNNGGSFGAQAPFQPSAMPLLPLALASLPGTTNVTVAQGHTTTLNPGSFGALTDNGIVFLNPGTYSFSSVTLGTNAELISQPGGSTSVLIAGTLTTNPFAQIFPAGQTADKLTISVSGSDGANQSPPAASIGANTQIVSLLNVPHGTIAFGNNVQATGAFVGFYISAGTNVTLAFQSGFPPASQQPVGRQQLSGYITPAMAVSPMVGSVPGSAVLSVAVGLPEQNSQALQTAIQNVSNPASPSYRHFINAGTFASTYGAPASAYQQLIALLQSTGFSVVNTFPTNLLVEVSGPVSAINQTFFLNLNFYLRPDGTLFFAPDREPSINLSTTVATVLRISGLNNAYIGGPAQAPSQGSSPTDLFTGQDLRNAYLGCAQATLTGAGQNVGIFAGGGFSQTDISDYQNAYAPPNVQPLPVNWVPLNEQSTPNPVQFAPAGETTGDIEAVLALAPAAQVTVFETNLQCGLCFPGIQAGTNPCGNPNHPCCTQSCNNANFMANALHYMANLGAFLGINQFSNSWQADIDQNTIAAMDQFAMYGESYFASAGDNGAYQISSLTFPELYLPWQTVVGGTVLTMQGVGAEDCSQYTVPCSYAGETAWGGGGGGTLPSYPQGFFPYGNGGFILQSVSIPPYQQGLSQFATPQNPISATYRNLPDVSMVASSNNVGPANPVSNFNSGVTAFPGVETGFGGTSVSAPLLAGFMALVNEQKKTGSVGFANYALYASANGNYTTGVAGFNDIASGSNGYSATTGYDLATGLGTPNCNLIDALAFGGAPNSTGICCAEALGLTCQFQIGQAPMCCADALVSGQCCGSQLKENCGGVCCQANMCANGTCCTAGQSVCGSTCCSGGDTCLGGNCVQAQTSPTLFLLDAAGNLIATSLQPTTIPSVFEGASLTLVGGGFAAGQVDLNIAGTQVATVASSGPSEFFTVAFSAPSESGVQIVQMFDEGDSSMAVVEIQVSTPPP